MGLIDVPNYRSSHSNPTPRGGGLAITIAFLIFFSILAFISDIDRSLYFGIISTFALIALLGLLDDIYTLSKKVRIISWIGITSISILCGMTIHQITLPIIGTVQFGILSPVITFLWLIGVTNFFNFMDGINGIAGFEALIVSGFLGWVSILAGNELTLIISAVLFSSVIGFLPYNFPTARIFLGDVGSNSLGFILGIAAIIGSQSTSDNIPFMVPVILMFMFLLDASSTLIIRIPKGKSWLEPHRDHTYQRLIINGLSHVQVTLIYSLCSLLLGILGLLYFQGSQKQQIWILILAILPFLLTYLFSLAVKKKRWNKR